MTPDGATIPGLGSVVRLSSTGQPDGGGVPVGTAANTQREATSARDPLAPPPPTPMQWVETVPSEANEAFQPGTISRSPNPEPRSNAVSTATTAKEAMTSATIAEVV